MPRIVEAGQGDGAVASLEACVDALSASGFDPREEHSLLHAAGWLRRLGANRAFLGDILIARLATAGREGDEDGGYGPQVIPLARRSEAGFMLRAAIWPSEREQMLLASGNASFTYGLAHDHNFDFLTLGYFGPGYWSEAYEYEFADVSGWRGEPVGLRFTGRSRLDPGHVLHYRAHRDVHVQWPADSLSVSLNLMHVDPSVAWFDQYAFDVEKGTVSQILNPGASEAFLRIAVGLGGEEAKDLAERFAASHPSDRMRLHAFEALASIASRAECEALWRKAEASGARLVAKEASAHRRQLAEG
ncbi:hypothetical protein B2G71_09155 [Novosphingobium sp. PC22D]|uniref:transposase n=1 Tax=Novosphingobium sp. PC22D TaxID=1962403 RepID=UPI000BFAE131|nr:transposase [Novosphingobium sp. PC22D]PEQ12990.1 hypothetical protein B2G71_09155 [Novosphingobium sp. PC22D]